MLSSPELRVVVSVSWVESRKWEENMVVVLVDVDTVESNVARV